MDHVKKCLAFKMYTTTKMLGPSLVTEMANEAYLVNPELTVSNKLGLEDIGMAPTAPSSLFARSRSYVTNDQMTAFTVSITPHFANVPVAVTL